MERGHDDGHVTGGDMPCDTVQTCNSEFFGRLFDTGCHHPGFLVPSRGLLCFPRLASAWLGLAWIALARSYISERQVWTVWSTIALRVRPRRHLHLRLPCGPIIFSFLAHQGEVLVERLGRLSEHDSLAPWAQLHTTTSDATLDPQFHPSIWHPPRRYQDHRTAGQGSMPCRVEALREVMPLPVTMCASP